MERHWKYGNALPTLRLLSCRYPRALGNHLSIWSFLSLNRLYESNIKIAFQKRCILKLVFLEGNFHLHSTNTQCYTYGFTNSKKISISYCMNCDTKRLLLSKPGGFAVFARLTKLGTWLPKANWCSSNSSSTLFKRSLSKLVTVDIDA